VLAVNSFGRYFAKRYFAKRYFANAISRAQGRTSGPYLTCAAFCQTVHSEPLCPILDALAITAFVFPPIPNARLFDENYPENQATN
jgi:hypothetical protein